MSESAGPGQQDLKKTHGQSHVAERTPGEATQTLFIAVLLLLTVNVASYIFWLYAENKKTQLDCAIEQEVIQSKFLHVLKLPLAFFSQRAPTAIAKQIDQSESVSAVVGAFSQSILPELMSLVGIIAIMFWQNALLALIIIAHRYSMVRDADQVYVLRRQLRRLTRRLNWCRRAVSLCSASLQS